MNESGAHTLKIYEDYLDGTGRHVRLPLEDSHISAVFVTNEIELKDSIVSFAGGSVSSPYLIGKEDQHWRQIFFDEVRYKNNLAPSKRDTIPALMNGFMKAHMYSAEDIVEKIIRRWGPLWTTTIKRYAFVGATQAGNSDYRWQGFETIESYRHFSRLISSLAELICLEKEDAAESPRRELSKWLAEALIFLQWDCLSLPRSGDDPYSWFYQALGSVKKRDVVLRILNAFFRSNPVNLFFEDECFDENECADPEKATLRVVLDMRYGVTRILFHQFAKALVRGKKTNGIFICDKCHEPYMRTKKFIPGKKQYCEDCEI